MRHSIKQRNKPTASSQASKVGNVSRHPFGETHLNFRAPIEQAGAALLTKR
jgi:hypothetical protein